MAKKRFFVLFLVLALVAGHAYTLLQLTHGTFTSPDANGYFAQGALVARHGSTELEPESPLGYIGMHWLKTEDGRFFSRYPPGVGVLVAIPYKLFGPEAGILVMPILASLTLLFLFLLCRPHTGDWLALLATLLFAVQPTAATHALNWGSHTAVAFFLVAGLYFVDSWSRSPSWWKVFVGGLLLGVVPALRYAEVVAGAGIAIFLIYHVIRRRRYASHLLVAFAAAAIPVGLLMWRNHSVFGSPFDTGYALTGEQQSGTGFRWEFFLDKWRPYLTGLMGNGMGLFFGLGLAGLAGMFARRATLPVALLLALTIFPISIVYASYYWGGNMLDSGLRFLLPT
ncbi:MAG: glycosyltransferase family 39 protein, partial [Planctomycetota bacterium]